MKNLVIDETKYTPLINFDADNRIFELSGKSYPENTFEFYKPMIEWVKEYFSFSSKKKTVVNFEIIYFNSSSSKLFFDFFDILEEVHNNGEDIEINWIYDGENEVALEAGEDFKEDFENLNFNLVEK